MTWHKITENDFLPETENGFWLTNFPEITVVFGPTGFIHKDPPYVPSPYGWNTNWCLDTMFYPCGYYSNLNERFSRKHKRLSRKRVLEWLIPQRKDWWIEPTERAEKIKLMKKIWKNRPRDGSYSFSEVEFNSWKKIKQLEKSRVASLRDQWLKAKQGGEKSAESESTQGQDGKPT